MGSAAGSGSHTAGGVFVKDHLGSDWLTGGAGGGGGGSASCGFDLCLPAAGSASWQFFSSACSQRVASS